MQRTYKAAYLFCGIGGGALGFQQARREYRGLEGQFETIIGIDNDAAACADFAMITGAPVAQMDLFDRAQYTAWNGHEPPEGWHEVTAQDLRGAAHGVEPDIVFTSPPCKGFSALLPAKSANTDKYQALNGLTIRGIRLVCEAWAPALILLENVPRITTRGAVFLDEIKAALSAYGYLFHESTHDCGELGGLGQHRRRYLLIARNPAKLPAFVYQPRKFPLKSIGDVIGELPVPGTEAAAALGRMHELPKLQWRTWMRLALIPAGGDWRDLATCGWEDLRIESEPWQGNAMLGVMPWDKTAGTVTGNMRLNGSTPAAVADPRIATSPQSGYMGVNDWAEPAAPVTGHCRVQGSSSPAAVNDPRMGVSKNAHLSIFRICRMDHPGKTVTGANRPAGGALCVADPRVHGDAEYHKRAYRVTPMDETSGTITSGDSPSSGAICIADPRTGYSAGRHGVNYRVTPYSESAGTVTGATQPAEGSICVADPRLADRSGRYPGLFQVSDYKQPSGTVLGQTDIQCGAPSVADPRVAFKSTMSPMGVMDWNEPAGAVSGSCSASGGSSPGAVADPRLGCDQRSGTYGVMRWDEPAPTVSGNLDVHAGAAAVADVRIPEQTEAGRFVIIALDGTWHRPLTTMELAALQGLPSTIHGAPLQLCSSSDQRWRERIGNMVPVGAAEGIASAVLDSLLAREHGEIMFAAATELWVRMRARAVWLRRLWKPW